MHRLAAAIVRHGWVAYNIEYRRVGPFGGGGWPDTFADVAATWRPCPVSSGIDRPASSPAGTRPAGQLALWAGTGAHHRAVPPGRSPCVPAISLAGVVDLAAGRRGSGWAAARWRRSWGRPRPCPRAATRLGSPGRPAAPRHSPVLVHGTADTEPCRASLSADYVGRAVALGDDATFVPLAGAGHMDMITRRCAFDQVTGVLDRFLDAHRLTGPRRPPRAGSSRPGASGARRGGARSGER